MELIYGDEAPRQVDPEWLALTIAFNSIFYRGPYTRRPSHPLHDEAVQLLIENHGELSPEQLFIIACQVNWADGSGKSSGTGHEVVH